MLQQEQALRPSLDRGGDLLKVLLVVQTEGEANELRRAPVVGRDEGRALLNSFLFLLTLRWCQDCFTHLCKRVHVLMQARLHNLLKTAFAWTPPTQCVKEFREEILYFLALVCFIVAML